MSGLDHTEALLRGAVNSRERILALVGILLTASIVWLGVGSGELIRAIAGLAVVLLAVTIARQEWGGGIVIAVPFLIPNVSPEFGLPAILELALLTLAVALIYWNTLGRPAVSKPALTAVAVFAAAALLQTYAAHLPMKKPVFMVVAAVAGLIYGSCLGSSKRARSSFGFVCIPSALLALAEIGGFHNPWPAWFHATAFLGLDNEVGAHRAQSTFIHPLIAGGCLAGSAILMMQSRTRHSYPCALVLACGAAATVSRSAFLGMAAGLLLHLLLGPTRRAAALRLAVLSVVLVVVGSQISPLRSSIVTRFSNGSSSSSSYTDQPVRAYAISHLEAIFNSRPASLLVGHGVGYSQAQLSSLGGIDGYAIYDNQYVTSLFDLGLLVMFCVGGLVLVAIARAPLASRRLGLPAMAVMVVVVGFVDGANWVPTSVLCWASVGVASTLLPDAD